MKQSNPFQWSLKDTATDDKAIVLQRVATVPYLLQLANLSSTLLEALSTDVVHSCKCVGFQYFVK